MYSHLLHSPPFETKLTSRFYISIVGTWKINSGKTVKIDCPAKDEKHRFIFLRTRHAPESSGIREGNKKNGLVNCTFMAEVDAEEIEVSKQPHTILQCSEVGLFVHSTPECDDAVSTYMGSPLRFKLSASPLNLRSLMSTAVDFLCYL